MGRSIFITAIDTNAGKTWVSASMIRSLLETGINALALKPVACGVDAAGRNEDIEVLLEMQHLQHIEDINLHCFEQPAAPALAAAAEHRSINPDQLITWCEKKAAAADICLIEGVGGLMVPLNKNYLVCDWIRDMPEAEVWLVVGCKLGCINHALLSLHKLGHMGRSPTRIILNAVYPEDNHRLEPTRHAITPFLARNCQIHTLTHGSEMDSSASIIL